MWRINHRCCFIEPYDKKILLFVFRNCSLSQRLYICSPYIEMQLLYLWGFVIIHTCYFWNPCICFIRSIVVRRREVRWLKIRCCDLHSMFIILFNTSCVDFPPTCICFNLLVTLFFIILNSLRFPEVYYDAHFTTFVHIKPQRNQRWHFISDEGYKIENKTRFTVEWSNI